MMVDAGLQYVRIGEFAWSSYEPGRGRFTWEWLDRVVDILADAGLEIILGTPTATPPTWLAIERPEILGVGPDGRRRAYGSRRHTCPAPPYREESARIVELLVERYGSHQAITAWQVDNEPGNHDSARCWCDRCQEAFIAWLASRFDTIGELNEAWGTAFWSQTYPSFGAVRLPIPTMTAHNPALLLAHRRFASQRAVAALTEQYDIIRHGSPGRDITTNVYLGDLDVDAHALAALGGISSFDNYPHGKSGPMDTAFTLDLATGAAGRAWVMEQQPGPINWTPTNPPVPPNQVRVWAWQAALHGIERLLFFRWRAARHGQEQYHSGLLRHDGTPDRGFDEVHQLATELAGFSIRPDKSVALLYSYEDAWALEIDPHRAGLRHADLVLAAYTAARRLGFEVDVVAPNGRLSGYDLVVAPALHLVTAERIASIDSALRAGTTVVLGPRSLMKDAEDAWWPHPTPAHLTERLGSRVVESLSQTMDVTVGATPAGPWTDVLSEGGEVLARYGGGTYLDGAPAAVRNGPLVYFGASSEAAWLDLLAHLTGAAPHPAHLEVFSEQIIDHAALQVSDRR